MKKEKETNLIKYINIVLKTLVLTFKLDSEIKS